MENTALILLRVNFTVGKFEDHKFDQKTTGGSLILKFKLNVFIKIKLNIFKYNKKYLFEASLSINGSGMVFW